MQHSISFFPAFSSDCKYFLRFGCPSYLTYIAKCSPESLWRSTPFIPASQCRVLVSAIWPLFIFLLLFDRLDPQKTLLLLSPPLSRGKERNETRFMLYFLLPGLERERAKARERQREWEKEGRIAWPLTKEISFAALLSARFAIAVFLSYDIAVQSVFGLQGQSWLAGIRSIGVTSWDFCFWLPDTGFTVH